MDRSKVVCALAGRELGNDEEFRKVAYELGKAIAARKLNLVYGGGIQGIRGAVAATAIAGGSRVLGISVKGEDSTRLTLGTELKVATMHERMVYMLGNSDMFIALPGGLDTLEEISNVIFWANRNYHQKPLGLLNVNGFYDGLLSFLDSAAIQGFVPQATRITLVSAPTVDVLLDMLLNPSPKPPLDVKQEDQPSESDARKRKLDTMLRL